jgi:hypothetical protein
VRYGATVAEAGVDAEKLEILRRWGSGLQHDPRSEVAASGRAILMLIEEVERLHVLVWDRRLYPEEPPPPTPEPEPAGEDGLRSRSGLVQTLRGRLQREVPAVEESFPQPQPAPPEPFHT